MDRVESKLNAELKKSKEMIQKFKDD